MALHSVGLRHYLEPSECRTSAYRGKTDQRRDANGVHRHPLPAAHPISVRKSTRNEVDGGGRHWPASLFRKHVPPFSALSVQPLQVTSAAHAQQHSSGDDVEGPALWMGYQRKEKDKGAARKEAEKGTTHCCWEIHCSSQCNSSVESSPRQTRSLVCSSSSRERAS